jgi:hypothetical protein
MDHPAFYKHEKIDAQSIRLLHLESTCKKIGTKDILRGSLRTVLLAEPGSFDAISYACGGQSETEYILINGKPLAITENCRDGLRYLHGTHSVRTIWVDAVCIAPNAVDKATQIPLMTDIYGKSRTVYIWLGKPHPDGLSERGLNWLREASLNESPLLDVKLAQFPKNMHPREVAKAISILPRVLRGSKYLKNLL